jgi:hypothetical protein
MLISWEGQKNAGVYWKNKEGRFFQDSLEKKRVGYFRLGLLR